MLAERLTGIGKSDQKTWDKVFLALMAFCFFGWLAVMALDAVRFRWSQMPMWLQVVGLLLLLGSFYIFYLTFRENSYLSPAVRVQAERGQTVISTGPYRYVRHQMYAGFVLFAIGTALLLGSAYGLLGAALLIEPHVYSTSDLRIAAFGFRYFLKISFINWLGELRFCFGFLHVATLN